MRQPNTYLPDEFTNQTDTVQLITQTGSLAQELRYAYDYERAKSKQRVWARPQIRSYTQWLLTSYRELGRSHPELAPRSLINEGEFLLLAQECAQLDDLKMHASTIVAAWNLAWDENLWTDFQDIGTTENGEICNQWFNRIRRNLDQAQMITVAEIPQLLQRIIELDQWQPPKLYSLGFDEPSVAQSNLLGALKAKGLCEELTLEQPQQECTEPKLRKFESKSDEFSEMTLWVREQLDALGPDARIGIVCNELQAHQRMLRRSFESAFFDVDALDQLISIESSESFEDHRLAQDLKVFLHWTCDPQEASQLIHLAKSPYFPALGLHRKIQSWFDDRTSIRYYQSRCKSECLAQVVRLIPRSTHAELSFPDAVALLINLIKRIGEQADQDGPFSYQDPQAIAVLTGLVRQLSSIASIKPRISWRNFIEVFELFLSNQVISVSNQRAPVQITSRQASKYKQYDALWITNIAETEWPGNPNPNPFIPITMQKKALVKGVTHAQKLHEAQTLTEHWLVSSPTIVFSFVSNAEDGESFPSALLKDLPIEKDPIINSADLIEHGHPWSAYDQTNAVHEFQQRNGSIKKPEDAIASTGLLRNQVECPFRAFAIRRLDLREQEKPISRFPNALVRGSTFHWVAEEILKQYDSQEKLAKLHEKAIDQIIDSVWQREAELRRQPARFARHERARLKRWIEAWTELEVTGRPPWKVLALESPIEFECEGLTFKGRIDRIDTTGELERLVIDHKTGSPGNYRKLNWNPTELKDTQMPMYALGEKACDGLAYIAFKRNGAVPQALLQGVREPVEKTDQVPGGLSELLDKDKAAYTLKALKVAWEKALHSAVSDFLNGVADVKPVDEAKVCEYCHLSSLCRINEHKATSYLEEE